MRLGFIGLGDMGSRMAGRLLAAGHVVTVWNRNPAKAQGLLARGARSADSPRAAAEGHDIVLLCLLDQHAVEQVVFGPGGVVHGGGLRWLVDHSSISPRSTRDFAARLAQACGAQWIDAPVSGGVGGADRGDLAVMAGGSAEGLAAVGPVLEAYSRRVTLLGPAGAGQTAKLCNQTVVAATVAAIAEAVALAEASGLDAGRLPEALEGGWADSVLLRLFAPRMAHGYEGRTAGIAVMRKDLVNICAAARDVGLLAPMTLATLKNYEAAIADGLGEADLSDLAHTARRRS